MTTFSSEAGEVRLFDCFTVRQGGRTDPHRQLLRVVEGVRGLVDLDIEIVARFDYGGTKPWLRMHRPHLWSATGGDDAIVVLDRPRPGHPGEGSRGRDGCQDRHRQ